jgi:uncharacterized protein (TIGR03435 family)
MTTDDMELVREYAAHQSESAFAALVSRHANLVYSVALRQARDPQLAEEITQGVFIILARKAGSLGDKTILPGWLYRTACYASSSALKREHRRQHREHEAYMQSKIDKGGTDEAWKKMSPILEEAMLRLGQTDRDALVLRFFEGRSLNEVGAALGASEEAAKKRVNRALDKMRKFFSKRGIISTTAVIAGTISAHSVQAAPMMLANSVTAVAITQGAAAGGSTSTLIKGTLKLMAWSKAKTAIVIVVGIVFVTGTGTLAIKEIHAHQTFPWQVNEGGIGPAQVNQPPQVRILRSKLLEPDWAILDEKMIGLGVRAENVVASAYGLMTPTRATFPANMPAGRYDYLASLPGGKDANEKALQAEVKQKFGVVGRMETRDTDVRILRVKSPNAPGLKRNEKDYGNALKTTPAGFHGWNESMSNLASLLEDMSTVPVIDETGLSNRFDFDLNCKRTDLENDDWKTVNEALDPLGLELVATNMPVEMLIVERVR